MRFDDRRDSIHLEETLEHVRERCRSAGPLDHDEAEGLANLLLRVFSPNPEYPTRASLEHRTISLHSLDDGRDPVAHEARVQPAPPEGTSPSLQALIARLLVAANLISPKQRAVARAYLYGFTLVEIAELMGLPYTTVAQRWKAAKRRLREALEQMSAEGLHERLGGIGGIDSEQIAEVFRAQQRPVRYEPPRHCPRGRERCARTGVCARRGFADRRVYIKAEEE